MVAVLAVIGTVIAASEGWLTNGTSPESARVEASKIIDFGNRVHDSVTLMASLYQVPDYGWNPQNAGTGWFTQCNDGTCSIFCDSNAALSQGSSYCVPDLILPASDYAPAYQGTGTAHMDAGNIFLALIQNVGTTGKGQIVLGIRALNQTICQEINRQLGFGSIAPTETNFGASISASGYGLLMYSQSSSTITEPTGITLGTMATQFAGQQAFCVGNGSYSGTYFSYFQVLVVR